jgi:chemotaxis protein histidine kinase CheA
VRTVVARLGGQLRMISRPTGGTTVAVMLPTVAR